MHVTFGAEKTGDGGPSGITFWGCREWETPVELLKVEAYGWAPVLLWVILKEKPDDVAAWVRSFLRFNPQCNVQENPWVKSRLSADKSKAPWHSSAIKI